MSPESKLEMALLRLADKLERKYPFSHMPQWQDANLLRQLAEELSNIEHEERQNELKSRSRR